MTEITLHYPLVNGYIHNWLVAGPQAIEVAELERFSGAEYKLQIAQYYYQPEYGLQGNPIEFGVCQYGDFNGKWRYLRTLHDHLVDLSVFHHITHYLRAWAYTEIDSPFDQEIDFVLTTNGPADVWINDCHVHRQEHFYHQAPKRVGFRAQLKEGKSQLKVRFEEVAARECPYSMALQLQGFQAREAAEEKVVGIPTGAPNLLRRMKLELLFEACHIRQDVYPREDEIMIYLPEGPAAETDFAIRLQNLEGAIYGELNRHNRMEIEQSFGFPYQVPEGNYHLLFMPTLPEYYETNCGSPELESSMPPLTNIRPNPTELIKSGGLRR
jgi:hypothetical protein